MSGVTIIDSGGANIASLSFALNRLGVDALLTSDAERIRTSDRVILPGVGAAADAMRRLKRQRLDELIPELKQPVLGICLGLQLLAEASEEGDTKCLGLFPGIAEGLSAAPGTPVPHMGWSRISITRAHPLLNRIESGSYFYFLHSFALPPADYAVATAVHSRDFTAVLASRNFVAAQFHPERSSAAGEQFLSNFLEMKP